MLQKADIADYDPDVDYEGSEPEVEPVTEVEREVDPDAENQKWRFPMVGPSTRG